MNQLFAISALLFVLGATTVQAQPACQNTANSKCTTPVISLLSATPATIIAGQSTVLSWNVSGQTALTFSSGNLRAPVTQASPATIRPQAIATYTLTATNAAGSTSRSVTVTVEPPGVTPPSPAPAPGAAKLTACGDITRSGAYYLANDVSSTVGCFDIDANGVTLNLNGHTITYDTGGSNNSPAIQGHDCWSTTNPVISGNCGNSHGGLEVYGGTIRQAVSGATFSPVFEFGQSNSISPAPYVHNITAVFQNTGAQFYLSRDLPPGARIENNTIYDNVTTINRPGQGALSARSDFQGQAIFIGQGRNYPGSGDRIEGNTIIGSPQGGVYSDDQYTIVSGNDISMNAIDSNDFCDVIAADHQVFDHNNCHPKSGRGVHTNSSYSVISNNTIAVTELKQNAEYNGCEGGGAFGVQVEYDKGFMPTPPTGIKVTGNTITAKAGACDAIGFRITSTSPKVNAAFTGNTVTTTSGGGAGQDLGISLDSEDGSGLTFTGNTFQSSYAYAGGDWDGYSNTHIGHNTWQGKPAYTFVAADGGCNPAVHDNLKVCPVDITFTDNLPNTVRCGNQSEATVTIGSQVKRCGTAH